jgi:hypothetical protein
LLLKILPLRMDAPIYLSDRARLACGTQETCLALKSVKIVERHRAELKLASKSLISVQRSNSVCVSEKIQ